MYIKITQHYCIMEKMGGKICDSCRTLFRPGDVVVELCEKCANTVWCVVNIYEDGSKELSSIHRSAESAEWFRSQCWLAAQKFNPERNNKIVNIITEDWTVL